VWVVSLVFMGSVAADTADTNSLSSSGGKGASVLVIGGSGQTGRLVLEQLETAGVSAIGLTRDVEKARAKAGAHHWMPGNVKDPESLKDSLSQVNYVIFAAAATIGMPGADPREVDYRGVCNVAKLAIQNDIQQLILISALSVTNPTRVPLEPLQNSLRWKMSGEDCLRESGLNYTIVRPGKLVNSLKGKQNIFLDQGDRVGAAITLRADVAAIIIESLGNPDAFNKTFEIFNFETGFEVPRPVQLQDLKRDAVATTAS